MPVAVRVRVDVGVRDRVDDALRVLVRVCVCVADAVPELDADDELLALAVAEPD